MTQIIKLNSLFNRQANSFAPKQGYRHIIKEQMIQGDQYEVKGFRRTFYQNPNKTYSCYIWNDQDSICIQSDVNESLQSFVDRTADRIQEAF